MASLLEIALSNKEIVLLVALVMRAGLAWQSELTWYEYRTLHGLKRIIFPPLDRIAPFGFGSFVNEKGGRDDPECLGTVSRPYRAVAKTLRSAGGDLHLISSVKRRPEGYGDPLSIAHVTFLHDGNEQTEAYLFANADGTTDVYAHHEPSPADPDGHLGLGDEGGDQADGDPRGVVTAALSDKI